MFQIIQVFRQPRKLATARRLDEKTAARALGLVLDLAAFGELQLGTSLTASEAGYRLCLSFNSASRDAQELRMIVAMMTEMRRSARSVTVAVASLRWDTVRPASTRHSGCSPC